MRTIRISDAVWKAMAEYGKFGETADDVLRRILKVSESNIQPPRPGKIAFIDSLLAAKGENRKTKAEIIELFRKEFPKVAATTAKNSVFWCASTFKKRTGNEPNHLP